MPGLLQSPTGKLGSAKFVSALIAEFVGVLLFALFGSVVPAGANGAPNYSSWGNGLTLGVLVYITANISGGHLNPAITLGTIISRHMSIVRGSMYIICQILGAIFGVLLVAGLAPGANVGMGNSGTGCFHRANGINKGQLFGWEFFMTTVLVSTVFAVAVGKPNFGVVGPLIVGVSLWAMAICAGQFTGGALNPARVLGPAAVFHCYWGDVWVYLFAHLLAAIVSGLIAWPLYGDALEVLHGKPLSDGPGKREKAEVQNDTQPPSDVRDQRNDQRNDEGNVW